MSKAIGYTMYVPGKPLEDQLEVSGSPTGGTADIFDVPFTIRVVEFKPLKINDKMFNISLMSLTDFESPKNDKKIYLCNRYTFTIKRHETNQIIVKDLPSPDIEQKIREIFESTDLTKFPNTK